MSYVRAIIAGVVGAAIGWLLAAGLAIAIGSLFGAPDFEGALGMQAIFGVGPLGGLVGLVAGVLWAMRRGGHGIGGGLKRLPLVVAAIVLIGAGASWVAYEMRPMLGTSSSGAPRLYFELRFPAGIEPPAPASRIRIELSTEENRMPGQVADKTAGRAGDQAVAGGWVELYYRSSWRLLEVIVGPDQPTRIFDLKLAARPGHMKDFGPWQATDFIATGSEQPRKAPASDGYAIRYRVVYRDAELAEARQKANP